MCSAASCNIDMGKFLHFREKDLGIFGFILLYCCPLKLRPSRARVCMHMHARDEVLADNNILEYIPRKTAIHSTLITTYGLTHNECSSDFISVVTLEDLFAE